MYNKAAHKQYANVHFNTLDRGRLLLMMYDGGVNFLRHAKTGLLEKDIPKFARYLSKSQAIIAELMNTLDFEVGGTIAKDLDRLYDFMLFYLTEANLQKDPNKIQKVIDLLETISGAYREVIESGRFAEELAALERGSNVPTPPKAPETPASAAQPVVAEGTPIPGQRLRVSL